MLTDRDYELLSNYLDDALTAAERANLETRLKAEMELRSELDALRGTVALVNALPPRKAPRNFTLDASMARRPAPHRMYFSPVLVSTLSAAAAVLLIGFGLLSFMTNQTAAPQAVYFAAEEQQDVAQLPTETALLKTSDGSVAVTAISDAAIAVPPSDTAGAASDTNDLLNQTGLAGGGAAGPTRDDLELTQPQATMLPQQFGQMTDQALAESTQVAPAVLAAPTFTGTLDGFTMLAPAVPSGTVQEDNAQAIEENAPAMADQSSAGMAANSAPLERTLPTPTPLPTEITSTPTVSPSSTPTEALPTLSPVPATSAPILSGDSLPLFSLGLGLMLLLFALVYYLRSRGRS